MVFLELDQAELLLDPQLRLQYYEVVPHLKILLENQDQLVLQTGETISISLGDLTPLVIETEGVLRIPDAFSPQKIIPRESHLLEEVSKVFGKRVEFDPERSALQISPAGIEKGVRIFLGETNYGGDNISFDREGGFKFSYYDFDQRNLVGCLMITPPEMFKYVRKNGLLYGDEWTDGYEVCQIVFTLGLPGRIIEKMSSNWNIPLPPRGEEAFNRDLIYAVKPRELIDWVKVKAKLPRWGSMEDLKKIEISPLAFLPFPEEEWG